VITVTHNEISAMRKQGRAILLTPIDALLWLAAVRVLGVMWNRSRGRAGLVTAIGVVEFPSKMRDRGRAIADEMLRVVDMQSNVAPSVWVPKGKT
jgi:hypothetical protein